ncbi:MAG: Rnase Y domain-containing protein [Bdellovibrionales bacterium]|jgi:ribonuclease Y|nr:Rnase Y domain-containing protein [Bdellovibrionales bacterium]
MIIAAIAGLLIGVLSVILISRLQKASLLREARAEASAYLEEAKDRAESLKEESQLAAEEVSDAVWAKHEGEIAALETRVKDLDDRVRSKRSQMDREYNADRREVDQSEEALAVAEREVRAREQRLQQIKDENGRRRLDLVERLQEVSSLNQDVLRGELVQKTLTDANVEASRKAAALEEETKLNAEQIAKQILYTVLNRFPRLAPTERGIGVVEIPNPDVKKRMLGEGEENIRELERLTGVGLSVTEKDTFQLASYDPVAREVATRTLEKLLHEKSPTVDTVRRLHEKTSGEVSRRIENDGNKIAAELGQRDLNPEIKRRLGQLRYRYSFAQNQHFHVAEVGWLCGLLASELGGTERGTAKRAGLLHDVGKAMDHAIEGGHAVIGADFIAKHGEKPDVVHAVKAHHYEEQPATDLCYLVIAADAISGARPGARRSTVSVYNQKIEVLSTIAEGFPGVTKTLIFNAGREVRILADARRVNDKKALELCRKIADKIEDECQYPGQIKVVVVRETSASSMAR